MSTRKKISILLSILSLTAMTVSCTTLVQKAENVAQNSSNPEISRFLEYYRNHVVVADLRRQILFILPENISGSYGSDGNSTTYVCR